MSVSKKHLWLLILTAFAIPLVPWLLLGPWLEPQIEALFSHADSLRLSPFASATTGMLLLCADSLLPVPSTLVMSGLGFACGVLLGGFSASLGLFMSGSLCYLACKRYGRRAATRLAGAQTMEKLEGLLQARGPLLVAATRAIPLFQEACACLAGVGGMNPARFFSSLALGCLPTGFLYATIGATASAHQGLALLLSILLPALSWLLLHLWQSRAQAKYR